MRPLLLLIALIATLARAASPNILVVLTDDVGWGDYRCYNPQGKIASPNVDRLAREGIRFTHAHTPAALCAPTRYSMLTGNFPWRGRDPGGTWGFNVPAQFREGQQTVANLLHAAGYRTAMFGKSGIGGKHVDKDGVPDFTQPMTDSPKRWGFDYSFIIPRGHQTTPYLFLENELPFCDADKLVRPFAKKGGDDANYAEPDWDNSKVGERLLSAAEKFLDDLHANHKTAPFFMHFCTDGAHSPYAPAPSIRGHTLDGMTKMTPHTDMVHETDILLGELMTMLEHRDLLANTMICLTSDNGGIPTEQHLGHDAVGGLRGYKSTMPEGGHRVPFIVWKPGMIPAAVRDQVVCTHDIVATSLDLAGVTIPAGQCLDAVSLLPVLTGKQNDSKPVRRHLLVQSSPGHDASHDGGIKGGPLTGHEPKRNYADLSGSDDSGTKPGKAIKKQMKKQGSASDGMAHALYMGEWKLVMGLDDTPFALYDLSADLIEHTNLINDAVQAERVKEMEKVYRETRASNESASLSRTQP
ncbi:MAG: sulfatase-like hydrolase/transferase [Verrucomicrobiaceae bacterium]|nr:sulfatase-like hydrolase/transferase [Verrucomicrobiaceae bacterium]